MEVKRLVQLLAMMQTDQVCRPSDRSHVLASLSKFSRPMTPKQMHVMTSLQKESKDREKKRDELLPEDSSI